MQFSETVAQPTCNMPAQSLTDEFEAWLADVARNEAFLMPIDPMERPLNAVSLEPEFAI